MDRKSIRRIIKDRQKIMEAVTNGMNSKRKRVKTGKIDGDLLDWVRNIRGKNVAVTEDLVKVGVFRKFNLRS